MGALTVFLSMTIVAMVDPIIAIGAAAVGYFARPFWYAVIWGIIWGLLVVILGAELSRSMHERMPPIIFATQTAAAVMDSLLVWWIVRIFRRREARKQKIDGTTKT